MRTRTIARWRRAALAGTLAATLASPGRAQQDLPPPVPVPQQAAEPVQPATLRAAKTLRAKSKQPAEPVQQPEPAQQPERAQRQEAAQQPEPAQRQEPVQQAEPAQPAATAQRPENAALPISEDNLRPPPDKDVKPVPGAPDEYTIQKGDTLWDLSQKFLNNPWYWPKIWSLNPSIENPHWIYPGNKLRIVPGEGGAQAPAQVAAEEPAAEPGIDATALNAPEEPLPLSTETNVSLPTTQDLEVVGRNVRESQAAQNMVSVSGKLAFSPPAVLSVRSSGLVSPEEMREAGTLEASFEEKQMLANYDTAYARFDDEVPAKPGDKMLIFRVEGPIVHPVTGRTLARQTKTVGVVKVLAVNGNQATIQIERTFEEVERGDMVRPWAPQDRRVAPRPNTVDVIGRIVQAVNGGLSTYGEQNEVFIDRGSADGVQEGNTFAVVRQGDGLGNAMVVGSYTAGRQLAANSDVPEENVGLLLVVDAREHISTAVVVKSIRELQAGDFVEMRATGSGGGVH